MQNGVVALNNRNHKLSLGALHKTIAHVSESGSKSRLRKLFGPRSLLPATNKAYQQLACRDLPRIVQSTYGPSVVDTKFCRILVDHDALQELLVEYKDSKMSVE